MYVAYNKNITKYIIKVDIIQIDDFNKRIDKFCTGQFVLYLICSRLLLYDIIHKYLYICVNILF